MNTIKNTIKFALLGTAIAALASLTSCVCGSSPEPVEQPVYVAPPHK